MRLGRKLKSEVLLMQEWLWVRLSSCYLEVTIHQPLLTTTCSNLNTSSRSCPHLKHCCNTALIFPVIRVRGLKVVVESLKPKP